MIYKRRRSNTDYRLKLGDVVHIRTLPPGDDGTLFQPLKTRSAKVVMSGKIQTVVRFDDDPENVTTWPTRYLYAGAK